MAVRTYAQQKAGLTRVVNRFSRTLRTNHGSHDVHEREVKAAAKVVIAECTRAVREWASDEWRSVHRTNAWPDNWHRWNIALLDATNGRTTLDEIDDLGDVSVH